MTRKHLLYLAGTVLTMAFAMPCSAQVATDSIADDFRSLVARHFSRYRTVNLTWETKWRHDYTLTHGNDEVERGKKKDQHTIRFSTMVPIVKKQNLSLYANVQFNSYQFRTEGSTVFTDDSYNYYAGGFNGSYYFSVFGRPLIASANVTVDGWDRGWGKVQGRFSATMVVRRTAATVFTAGVMGMTLFNTMPVMPVISYWHRFANPDLSIEITMPSQFYVRYQYGHQRISAGASMSADNFYLRPNIEGVPAVCYYSEAVLRPEVNYEYIISRHFYISVRAGASMVMKGGLYTKNRKGVKVTADDGSTESQPLVQQSRPVTPFFSVGLSYSLFK